MPFRQDRAIGSVVVQGGTRSCIFVATGVVGLIGSALAADLTGAEITFLSGKTMYLKTTAASSTGKAGQGVIYWADNGTALYKTPMGTMWHGKWEIKGKAEQSVCALGQDRRHLHDPRRPQR